MQNKDPKKHHYIPQFILKNFCFDDKKHVVYYREKAFPSTMERVIREIFMEKDLYRDDLDELTDPVQIEKDLARFEAEAAQIITKKFLREDKIAVTLEEEEKLKVFLAIMGFRSKNTKEKFGNNVTEENKCFYDHFQKDGDLERLWKRNLKYLVNCRSFQEISEHREIDMPIKLFMRRDIKGYYGLYFVVLEKRGPIDFVISDAYPTVINGMTAGGIQLLMYSIFPISPERAILLAANGVEGASERVSGLKKSVLRKPKREENAIIISVKKVYENEVRRINSFLIKEARQGYAFKDEQRV